MLSGSIVQRPVLDIVIVAGVPLARVIQFILKDFQQTGLSFLRRLTIRSQGQNTVYFLI
jgi:hypothetical protein